MADAPQDAFLGVERSVGGKRWLLRAGDERAALRMAQQLGVPEIVARVLAGRGIDVEAAPSFLDPRLRDLLPDPSHLKDMDKAAARVAAAVREGKLIAI